MPDTDVGRPCSVLGMATGYDECGSKGLLLH